MQRDLGARLGRRGHLHRIARHATCRSSSASNNIPMQYLSTSRTRDTANETFLTPERAEPVRRPAAGQHDQRRDGAAPAAAAAVSASSARSRSRSTTGSDSYNAGTLQLEKRFTQRQLVHRCSTRTRRLRDKLNYLNPADGSSRIASRRTTGRTASRSARACGCRSARDEKWGSDWNGATDAVARRLAGERHLSVPVRLPADVRQQHLLRRGCGDPSSLDVEHRREGQRRRSPASTCRRWDTSCFYFHDAAVQTNGVDDPVEAARRPAHPAGQQRALLPVDAAGRADATTCTCWTSGSTRTSRCRASMKLQFRIEVDQRAELHGAVEPGRRSESHERPVRLRQHGSQQPARHSDRAAVDVLGR